MLLGTAASGMIRLGQVSISSIMIGFNETADLSTFTGIAFCQNKVSMSENGSFAMRYGNRIIGCPSEADVSRLHKLGLRSLRGVQEDIRVC